MSGSTGSSASAGTSGTAASTGVSGIPSAGKVARPSYNTGKGFFVLNGKLYDANGAEFRIRGVNKLHWDLGTPGIPATHANTERWDIDFTQPTSTNIALMQGAISSHMVPMPGNWNGTCSTDPAVLSSIVDTWVAQESAWQAVDDKMILNIANEWGPFKTIPSTNTVWRDSYITAIGRLRTAGYLATISVTSGGCGQDPSDLLSDAVAVEAADPQHNVIFDQHVYGLYATTDVTPNFAAFAALGVPVIIGEFGPGQNIGPSPTLITPTQVITTAESDSLGWLAWAWDDNIAAGDSWFALSTTGNYTSSADLTTFGKVVVENPTYGLLALARANTAF